MCKSIDEIARGVRPQEPRLSPSSAMARVLRDLYRGLPPWAHCEGRAMPGGTGRTEEALRQRGLVTGFGRNLTLTEAGRQCAARLAQTGINQPSHDGSQINRRLRFS